MLKYETVYIIYYVKVLLLVYITLTVLSVIISRINKMEFRDVMKISRKFRWIFLGLYIIISSLSVIGKFKGVLFSYSIVIFS